MQSISNADAIGKSPVVPCGLETALALSATLNWAVFPLNPATGLAYSNESVAAILGIPTPAQGDGGFHLAGSDEASVRAMFTYWPDAQIGIATGAASGLYVLDIDRKHGKDGFATIDRNSLMLGHTFWTNTKSGGRHYFYTIPRDGTTRFKSESGALGPGVDRRGDGGLVRWYGGAFGCADGVQMAPPPDWMLWDAGAHDSKRTPLGDPAKAAPSLDAVRNALALIDPDELGFDEWIKMLAAAKQAAWLHGQSNEIEAMLLEWCARYYEDNARDSKYQINQILETMLGWQSMLRRIPALRASLAFGAVPAIPPMPAGARLPGAAVPDGTKKPLFDPAPITHAEWADTDALTPPCIVADMYFADVGLRVAPGGVGKTTLALYEAMCMALCRPIFGNAVRRSGATCILTSEDQRPMLVQRLRKICEAAHLSPDEIERVKQLVRIQYVEQFKLTRVDKDIVVPSDGVQHVIEAFGSINPSIIWIDPAVSFGVGESRVNDAEQGLITAARMIRNAIPNCAVMFIHHTGKANAREKTIDQYSGRGGSALADGSRMVQVMQSLTPNEWQAATGGMLAEGETGFVIARPKLSYAPKLPELYVRRAGWSFVTVQGQHPAECSAKADEVFMRLLRIRNEQGRYVNATSGSAHAPKVFEGMSDAQGITKTKFKEAMDRLFDAGKIQNREINPGSKAREVIFPVDS